MSLSPRLYELQSCIDQQTQTLIRMQLNLGYDEMSIMLIGQYEPLQCKRITQDETAQLLNLINKPAIPNATNTPSFNILKKKANKILMKQYALKNILIFKHRKNLGTRGLAYMNIGKEINELSLNGCDRNDIVASTRELYCVSTEVEKCHRIIHKQDNDLIIFDVEQFYKKIKQQNYLKLQKSANNNNGRKKKVRHLKKRVQNKNKNKNKNNEEPKQIANNISHQTRCKYSQLINFRIELCEIKYVLKQLLDDLFRVALNLRIIDKNHKCKQEVAWKSVFDNEITVQFVGKTVFLRIKKLKKTLNKYLKETDKNIQIMDNTLNETVWRSHGKFKNKKSLMQRVEDYETEKANRRYNYRVSTNFKKCMKQLLFPNAFKKSESQKKESAKQKKKEIVQSNKIKNYFRKQAKKPSEPPPCKKRRVDNGFITDSTTTHDLAIDESDSDDDDIEL